MTVATRFYAPMTISTRWREKVVDARKRAKLTQEGLAEKIGIGQSSIDKYENGTGTPKLETLLALARVLDVSLDYLFDDSRTESVEFDRQLRRAIKKLGGVEAACDRLSLFDGSSPGPRRPDK